VSAVAQPHPAELVEFVLATNRGGGHYHRMDFGAGLVLDGEYDMSRYLGHYGFPDDLSGIRALDVGTSTGYFAVELARRGAIVTAIDVWDGSVQDLVFRGMGVDVRYVQRDLFELEPSFGAFDLVFCGSVLQHTWDQFTALQRLRSVCSGRLILATTIMRSRWIRRTPVARFVGTPGAARPDGGYWTTWYPTAEALVRMVEVAGFGDAEFRGSFRLRSEAGHHDFDALHGVVHAAAPPDPTV
jgi:tRNA (mo5U34)-methyltransferase